MALLHATLTEDESVLLEALDPRAGDRCLALFAKGNGDAALALVAAGADTVEAHDLFDLPGLEAQLALKKRMISSMSPQDLRKWMGLEPGFGGMEREASTANLLAGLEPAAREYWESRRDLLARGMVACDETRAFGKLLGRITPWMGILKRLPWLLRLGLVGAPLFYPEPERRHSLGYRQLREDPLPALALLVERAGEGRDGDFVGASRMAYLMPEGLERLRTRLDAVQVTQAVGAGPYGKVYLSNLIDWMSGSEFGGLLDRVLDRCAAGARLFLNSTRRGDEGHPSLAGAIAAGRIAIDEPGTRSLRERDRLGVYPGLTAISMV